MAGVARILRNGSEVRGDLDQPPTVVEEVRQVFVERPGAGVELGGVDTEER